MPTVATLFGVQKIPADIVDSILVKCGRHCCLCREFKPNDLQVHHILPKGKGGTNDPDNLIPLCLTCHMHVETKYPFTRGFSANELTLHRNNLYRDVAEGKLQDPETDEYVPSEDEIMDEMEAYCTTESADYHEHEMHLLIAAAESPAGEIHVTPAKFGINVLIGDRDFANPKTARIANQWQVTLEKYVKSGSLEVTAESPELTVFSVTRMGFDMAEWASSTLKNS